MRRKGEGAKRKGRGLIVACAFVVAVVAFWLWPRGAWREYVSPPLGKAKWRVRMMIPADWEAQRSPSGEYTVFLAKPERLVWLPGWVRNRLHLESSGEDYVAVSVEEFGGSGPGGNSQWLSYGSAGGRMYADPRQQEVCYIVYRRETETTYAATLPVIQRSLRVTHD